MSSESLRSERLLAILQYLRNRTRATTASELAQEFSVSERTIYRDIAVLNRLGAIIDGASGFGYVLRRDKFLPPLMLNDVETDAVVLGLKFVEQRGDHELSAAARIALAKITTVLPEDIAKNAQLNGLLVAPSGAMSDTISIIRHSIKTEYKVRLSYRDRNNVLTERTVLPVAIGFFDRTAIVAAWCELRHDFRHFRVDLITGVEKLQQCFHIPHRNLLAKWKKNENIVDL